MSKDMYDSKLLKIYRKNPISCYENILAEEEEEINDICRCVLLVLYSIDEVIKKLTGLTYNYYIENSESVFYVFHLLQLRELNEEQFEKSIFILDFSKLIYHFTCAKKFLIKDDTVCQLRINSWGREYIKCMKLLDEYMTEYWQIRSFVEMYCNKNKIIYNRLIQMLSGEIDESIAHKIDELNKQIKIKLLS